MTNTIHALVAHLLTGTLNGSSLSSEASTNETAFAINNAIAHGNTRPIVDTVHKLNTELVKLDAQIKPMAEAEKKAFSNLSPSQSTAVKAAAKRSKFLIANAVSFLETLPTITKEHFNSYHAAANGKLTKQLSNSDLSAINDISYNLAQKYAKIINDLGNAYDENLRAAGDLRKEKTQATIEAKKEASKIEATINAKKTKIAEAAEAAEAAKTAANTLTISDFLTAIKHGDKNALAMAQTIGAALQAYQTSKANTQHAKNGKKLLEAMEKIAA